MRSNLAIARFDDGVSLAPVALGVEGLVADDPPLPGVLLRRTSVDPLVPCPLAAALPASALRA